VDNTGLRYLVAPVADIAEELLPVGLTTNLAGLLLMRKMNHKQKKEGKVN